MVLELIAIGGAVYYYARKNKQNKAKQAAFAAGQPWTNKDGTVTYPPNHNPNYNHRDLPAYTPMAPNNGFTTGPPPAMSDYKRQNPQPMWNPSRSVPVQGPEEYQERQREEYRDEKAPLVQQTRDMMNRNEKY